MPCDKDFGYVILTRGLTWERYSDLWQLTYITISETTPEDHVIILCELLAGNKTLATSSSIWARVNGSRVQINCSRVNVKLHLSCTIYNIAEHFIYYWNINNFSLSYQMLMATVTASIIIRISNYLNNNASNGCSYASCDLFYSYCCCFICL